MPLSITVGLSRKASRDYQSAGVSINVTAELDSALLAKPQELQQQVAYLYAQAETAMERQAGRSSPASPRPGQHPDVRNGSRASNGHRNGGGMTASQRRAIEAIAHRAGLDAGQEVYDQYGIAFDALSLRQASEMIDRLKGITATDNGNGDSPG